MTSRSEIFDVFAMLRTGVIQSVEATPAGLMLAIHIPSIAAHFASSGSRLRLCLLQPGTALLESWDRAEHADDPRRLAQMNLEILGVVLTPDGQRQICVRSIGNVDGELRGGILRLSAELYTLSGETGGSISFEELRRAAAEAARKNLLTRSTKSHARTLDRTLGEYVEPLLRCAKFISRRRTFLSVRPQVAQVIRVETWRWNSPISFSFWFELSVFVAGAFGERPKWTEEAILQMAYPAYNIRLSSLWHRDDEMYEISADTDLAALGQRLQRDLVVYAIPLLGGLENADQVVAFLSQENKTAGNRKFSFGIANVLARTGQVAQSIPYFEESIGDREAILRVAKSYGVELGSGTRHKD